MEFSSVRSSRKRTEETLPWAKAPQHSISNCATKQPSVWMKSGGKKIWQWSDCSPSTSNATISNPSMGCAGTRHTSSRSSSQWRASLKAKGKGPVVLQETKSHTPGLQPPEPFFTEQGQEDQSSHSPCLICSRRTQSQRRRSASCFLSNYLPTALEKQPRSAKNLQSPKF